MPVSPPLPGNLWLVWLGIFTLQSMGRTNHKFPHYGSLGIQSEEYVLWECMGEGMKVKSRSARGGRMT